MGRITVEEANELVNTAIGFFNNDSFWLAAPLKLLIQAQKEAL